MPCCLTAPSHYLNQFWLPISKVLWHSSGNNLRASVQAIILYNEFEHYTFKFAVTSPRNQWVNHRGLSWSVAALQGALMTGGTGDCHHDNLRCRPWRQSWHQNHSRFPVCLRGYSVSPVSFITYGVGVRLITGSALCMVRICVWYFYYPINSSVCEVSKNV